MKNQKFEKIKYKLTLLFLHSLGLFSQLPYRAQLWLGKYLGRLLMKFSPRMRKITKVNLELCFSTQSEQAREIMLQKSFESLGMGFFETLLAGFGRRRLLKKLLCSISGLELLEEARAQNRGVIILFPHIISMYLVGRMVAQNEGVPFSLMYHSPRHRALNDFMNKYISRYADKVFTRNDGRAMARYLKKGGVVWYAPDLDLGEKNSLFIPFFGVPAATLQAIIRITQLTNAQVMPIGFCRRPDKKGYDVKLYPPLNDFPSGNDVNDLTRINQVVEMLVDLAPEQYLWQYKRFSTQPDGRKLYV